MKDLRFINRILGKKALEALVSKSYADCGNKLTVNFLDKLKDLGFEYAYKSGLSIAIDDIHIPNNKDKTDLGQTHLIKSFVDLSKWKSERIAPKYYAKRDATTLNFDKNTPLVVKWDK